MTLEHLIREFIADGKYRRLSVRTLMMYSSVLKSFSSYCDSLSIAQFSQVESNTLKSYALFLQERELTSGGVALRFRVIRALFSYAEREEIENKKPFKRFKIPRIEQKVMKFVEFQEYEILLNAAKDSTKPFRDSAIVSVLYDTGIRVGELLNLKLDDIVSERGMLKVNGKTGERMVPISRPVLKRVRQYINSERPQSALSSVFLTNSEAPLNYQVVKLMLERTAKRAGMTYKSPHCFRRGFATRMIHNGSDVFSLQRILGHTTLTMTNRYAVLNDDALKQVHLVSAPTRK
jgi:integrase/recombinase XerD